MSKSIVDIFNGVLDRFSPEALGVITGSLVFIGGAYVLYFMIIRGLRTLQKKDLLPVLVGDLAAKSVKYLLIFISIFFILQNFGIPMEVMWGALSAFLAMVAIGFVAVWRVVSNTLCAFILIITRPFRIGDTIELLDPSSEQKGARGRVINISMIYTTLLEGSRKNTIMIPNNLFFQKSIRRYRGKKTYSLEEQLMTSDSLLQTDES